MYYIYSKGRFLSIRFKYKIVMFLLIKLDGVGPVDNRPYPDKLNHFVKKKEVKKKRRRKK